MKHYSLTHTCIHSIIADTNLSTRDLKMNSTNTSLLSWSLYSTGRNSMIKHIIDSSKSQREKIKQGRGTGRVWIWEVEI